MIRRPEDTKVRALGSLLLLALCIGVAPSLKASVSFSGANAGSTTTVGNSLPFSGTGLNVTAYAFSTTGGSGSLAQAALAEYSGLGLGVCNSVEIAATCSSPNHAVDNAGNIDFVLLQFSVPLASISLTLNPFGTNDMDATYFYGTCSGTCTTSNFLTNILSKQPTTVGLSAITGVTGVGTGNYTSPNPASTPQTFTLNNPGFVNWVLIGASTAANLGGDNVNDYFKLQSMDYSTTPEPATFGLAGAALAAIALLRRKKSSTIV